MDLTNPINHDRRTFLRRAFSTAAASAALLTPGFRRARAATVKGRCCGGRGSGVTFEAGQSIVDITPPLQTELAGFHVVNGNRRLVTAIRQPAEARALVLRVGESAAAIVSIDMMVIPDDFCGRVANRVSQATGIPAAHVRVAYTHSHSMPTLVPTRQWGGVSPEYLKVVEDKAVQAAVLAKDDLAAAELSIGTARAVGGNFNRTSATWRTDEQFNAAATDEHRWLDTLVHVLRFDRAGGKPPLLWYHFSAHPVCFGDTEAGPDWPGLVARTMQEKEHIVPVFLQGHAGDVNPGDGTKWIGEPAQSASAIYDAVRRAHAGAKAARVDRLAVHRETVKLPFDMDVFKDQLARYRAAPADCVSGEWVDAGFAKDWFDDASTWPLSRDQLDVPVTAMQLGEIGLLFHPGELFSYYGLAIRHRSPMSHTLVVGYADGAVGYLCDPNRYKENGYEAVVVPKIGKNPQLKPSAGREFTEAMVKLTSRAFA